MKIIPSFCNCLTMLYLKWICICLPLKVLLFTITIAVWQSQRIDTDGVGFIFNRIFVKKFLSYSVSLQANSRVINSDSMVDLAMIVYLVDF